MLILILYIYIYLYILLFYFSVVLSSHLGTYNTFSLIIIWLYRVIIMSLGAAPMLMHPWF